MMRCRACGYASAGWFAACPLCRAPGSLETAPQGPQTAQAPRFRAVPLSQVGSLDTTPRRPCGLPALDLALGGGFVPGATVLLGGAPGLGKSTLALQALAGLRAHGTTPALYITAEEPLGFLRARADRLGGGARAIWVLAESDLEAIETELEDGTPAAVVVDSIQRVQYRALAGRPGSVPQVRFAAWALGQAARAAGLVLLLIAHVDKTGALAGPMVLQHDVDVTLMLEGEPSGTARALRVSKNRFGPTLGLALRMSARGLR